MVLSSVPGFAYVFENGSTAAHRVRSGMKVCRGSLDTSPVVVLVTSATSSNARLFTLFIPVLLAWIAIFEMLSSNEILLTTTLSRLFVFRFSAKCSIASVHLRVSSF